MLSVKNKNFWLEFIETYQSLECLWNVYAKNYSNKMLREDALEILVQKCKEIYPEANKVFVKKKIVNLRTTFSREYKKIEASKTTGSSAESIYETNLWYYDSLLFLKDGEVSRKGNCSIEDDSDQVNEFDTDIEQCSTPAQISISASSETSTFCPPPRRKRSNNILKEEQANFFKEATAFMSQKSPEKEDDEYDILGRTVASHFRNMEDEQRFIAEKLVFEILTNGRMKNLTLNSKFIVDPDLNSNTNLNKSINLIQPNPNKETPRIVENRIIVNPYDNSQSDIELAEFIILKD